MSELPEGIDALGTQIHIRNQYLSKWKAFVNLLELIRLAEYFPALDQLALTEFIGISKADQPRTARTCLKYEVCRHRANGSGAYDQYAISDSSKAVDKLSQQDKRQSRRDQQIGYE